MSFLMIFEPSQRILHVPYFSIRSMQNSLTGLEKGEKIIRRFIRISSYTQQLGKSDFDFVDFPSCLGIFSQNIR